MPRPRCRLARANLVRQTFKEAIRRWRYLAARDLWPLPGFDRPLPPLGVEGGIARALNNMQKLADLLAERGIPLTLVVYPWPQQIFYDDRESHQIAIWREFCAMRELRVETGWQRTLSSTTQSNTNRDFPWFDEYPSRHAVHNGLVGGSSPPGPGLRRHICS